MQTAPYLIIIMLLLIISALFSACEMAYSSVNRIRLKNYALQGNKQAKKALKIVDSFDDALTSILIGNNVVNIASASLCTILFTDLLGSKGVGISTAVMTILVLIFGEISPKSIAKENAERFVLFFATPLSVCIWIMKPFIFVFSGLKKLISRFFSSSEKRPSITEDELKYIIDEIEEEGVLEEQEGNLVRSALDFDEITVDEILIPRVNVVGIEINSSIEEIKEVFLSEMYSRMPVYEKSKDNIVGVITQKAFFKFMLDEKTDIREIMQDAFYISGLKYISQALREMQRLKIHMAIVMDQYGGTKGIITMEDIIEELVGEIYDENDEVFTSLTKIGENEYEVSGEYSLSDMLEELNLPDDLIESSANSVGGWVMELLGHIPEEDESIECGIFKINVMSVNDQTIEKIKLHISLEKEIEEE